MAALETIDHPTLTHLAQSGAVRSATAVGAIGGWKLIVQYGTTERAVTTRRGPVRIWRHFETLAKYLKDLGLARYQVDATGFVPSVEAAAHKKRPDVAARMKQAHEAAAYETWVRAQVQASIDDPRPSISHEEVEAHFANKRDALRRRIAQGQP